MNFHLFEDARLLMKEAHSKLIIKKISLNTQEGDSNQCPLLKEHTANTSYIHIRKQIEDLQLLFLFELSKYDIQVFRKLRCVLGTVSRR